MGALRVRLPNPLRKLYIRIDCDSVQDRMNLTSWIDYAIKCGVRELDLDLYTCNLNTTWTELSDDDEYFRNYVDYCLDFSCLMNSSIVDLKFHRGSCCGFPLLPPNVESANFTSVLSLSLNDVSFNSDEDFNRLMQHCTNLEHLTIVNCDGLGNLRIVSSRLKTCKICSRMKKLWLEITSPCLHSLFLSHVKFKNDLLNGCPNLVRVHLYCEERYVHYYGWWCDTLRLLTWIKYLVVQNMYFVQKFLPLPEGQLPHYDFYNLSYLEVHTGYGYRNSDVRGICSFLKNVPALEQLVLDYCYYEPSKIDKKIDEDLSYAVTLHIPRLERVKMKNYRATVGELYVLELLKIHGVVLKEVVAFPAKSEDEQSGDEWPKPYTLFLSSS